MYRSTDGIDAPTSATEADSDGDGMPDGWEILHRRWVGSTFTGGNNWSLDPNRPEDALWDADGDGLVNLCEYRWTELLASARDGAFFDSHGESAISAAAWTPLDPTPSTVMVIPCPTDGNPGGVLLGRRTCWCEPVERK